MADRIPRVFWRGRATAPALASEKNPTCDGAAVAAGVRERLAGASLTYRHPELFDVGGVIFNETDHKRRKRAQVLVEWLRCDAKNRGLDAAPASWRHGAAALEAAAYVAAKKFSDYQAHLSLPGSSNCSFSRHLNDVWAAGAAVLIWRWRGTPGAAPPMYVEWYYAGLEAETTHLEVGEATAFDAAAKLLAPAASERRASLGAAARQVHRELLCPCCLLDWYAALLRALGAKQARHDLGALLAARRWQSRRAYSLD